jgi:hypothetical protein
MRIRELFPSETALVTQFYREAPDYWLLAEGRVDPVAKAQDFFTDAPPNCNPAESERLGMFVNQRLSGVAELSYGFPEPSDAYLGLMLLWRRWPGNAMPRGFSLRCWTPTRADGRSGNARGSRRLAFPAKMWSPVTPPTGS